MKRPFLGLALLAMSASALAGGVWTSVTVKSVEAYTAEGGWPATGGLIVIGFSGNSTGGASCANGSYSYAVIDPSTSGGTAAISLAVRALSIGSPVTAHGTGNCGLNGTVETLAAIYTSQ